MTRRKIKILVVDDSVFFREMLTRSLREDPGLEVIGFAVDPYDAFDKIAELNPDVLTLDVEMPKMDGIAFLRKLMPENPMPVVVVSSLPDKALDALEAGAVDFVKKPQVRSSEDTKEFQRELILKIKIASIARITRIYSRLAGKAPAQSKPAPETPKTDVSGARDVSRPRRISSDASLPKAAQPSKGEVGLIAIGASTGGTDAVVEIVRDLPADSPGILVVQHMPAGFTRMYAERLDRICRMSVKECEDGDRVEQGRIIVAAGGFHMRLAKDAKGFYVKSAPGPKVSGHCPSVDALFESVAETAGSSAVGVILTGMGSDGAKGLLEMRRRGSFTIGQDKETCIVYGMPMVAFNIGAVEKQLPLERIGAELVRRFKS